jgi:hypothetical protein
MKSMKDKLGHVKSLEEKYGEIPSLEEISERDPKDILIGTYVDSQGRAHLNLDLLSTHLHVIGLTGVGKSCFLDLLCQSIIKLDQGLCLIDPHGFLYDSLVAYISFNPDLAKKTILFNPADWKNQIVGFNPMVKWTRIDERGVERSEMSKQIDYLTTGIAHIWADEKTNTPRLENNLVNTFNPIIEAGYSVAEARYFTWLKDSGPRNVILSKARDKDIIEAWSDFDGLTHGRKFERLESMINRMYKFTSNEMVRLTLGQTEHVLDFKDIFENQKILLVNLSQRGPLSEDAANIIGIFLINEMFNYSLKRTVRAGKEKPLYLVIDEFQNFLSPRTANIIDQCRKFGLHMVLSHQRLEQLLEKSKNIYSAVKDGARNKIIFAVSYDDAEILVKDVFAGEVDLKEIKNEIYRTTVLNYREETRIVESIASTYGHGSSQAEASGGGDVRSKSQLSTQMMTPGLFPDTTGISQASGDFTSAVSSWQKVSGFSDFDAESVSKATVPVFIPELGLEKASQEFYDLHQQFYKKAVGLVTQANQHAVIKMQGQKTKRVKIATLLPYPQVKDRIKRVEELSAKHQNQCYLPLKKREELLEARQKQIEKAAQEYEVDEERVPQPKSSRLK